MTNDDIYLLKRKRENIKMRIGEWNDKGKNAIELVKEYIDITDKLKAVGVQCNTKSAIYTLNYWMDGKYIKPDKQPDKPNKINNPSIEIKNKNEKYYYILNAACSFCGDRPWDFDVLTNYISSLELKLVKDDYNEYVDKEEIVMGYEFFGTEEEFNILKKCVQKVCDMIKKNSDTDMDVYGCKRNF